MPLIDFSTRAGFDSLYRIGAEAKWPHPNTRPEVKLHYCRSWQWPEHAAKYARYYGELPGMAVTSTVAVVGAGFGLSVEAVQQGQVFNVARYQAGLTLPFDLQPPLGHRLVDIEGQHNALIVTVTNYVTSSELTVDSLGNPVRSWLVRYDLVYATIPRYVAIDTSAYIQSTKDQDDEAEIIEWMTGILTPDDPRWKQILDEHSSKGVRLNQGDGRKSRVTILDESADSTRSRRNITGHFGLTGATKLDWAISELTLEGATDAEIVEGAGNMHDYAAQVAHTFIKPKPRQMPINFKTVEEWRALLPNDYLIDGQTGAVDVP